MTTDEINKLIAKEKKQATIYIAGAISNVPTAKDTFDLAEARLSQHFVKVINPMKLNHNHDKEWSSYMKVCLMSLMTCDYIYMTLGWEKSRGARIELNLAIDLGLEVRYQG